MKVYYFGLFCSLQAECVCVCCFCRSGECVCLWLVGRHHREPKWLCGPNLAGSTRSGALMRTEPSPPILTITSSWTSKVSLTGRPWGLPVHLRLVQKGIWSSGLGCSVHDWKVAGPNHRVSRMMSPLGPRARPQLLLGLSDAAYKKKKKLLSLDKNF